MYKRYINSIIIIIIIIIIHASYSLPKWQAVKVKKNWLSLYPESAIK